jgi:hypothetical protein
VLVLQHLETMVSNSVFSTITAIGGGGGGFAQTSGASALGTNANTGGSGGGGAATRSSFPTNSLVNGAAGTANQGFAGGTPAPSPTTS